jgi:hypothetical protein
MKWCRPTQARFELVWELFVTSYIFPASVSCWNGDNHLPPFFCQIDVAKTYPGCFFA